MAKNWTKLVKAYKGLWVALAEDETTVLGARKTVNAALLAAKKEEPQDAFPTHVPNKIVSYVANVIYEKAGKENGLVFIYQILI